MRITWPSAPRGVSRGASWIKQRSTTRTKWRTQHLSASHRTFILTLTFIYKRKYTWSSLTSLNFIWQRVRHLYDFVAILVHWFWPLIRIVIDCVPFVILTGHPRPQALVHNDIFFKKFCNQGHYITLKLTFYTGMPLRRTETGWKIGNIFGLPIRNESELSGFRVAI